MGRPASAAWMSRPTAVDPVKAILSMPGRADERRAGLAVAGQDRDDPVGQLGLLADLGQQQRGERRRLGRLEDRRVAAGQRGRELPRRHQQREVPGHDLADDAERRHLAGADAVAQLVGPAGVVEEVRGGERDVDVARFAQRLAAVERLDHRQLARALLDEPRDPEQVLGPLAVGQRGPPRLGGARRLDGRGDVGGAGPGDLGDRLLGGGVERRLVARRRPARGRRRR